MVPLPCYENGVDCSNRHIGCQSQCEKYRAFRAELDANARKKALDAMCADYSCAQIYKDRHKLRHTPDGRRALAQR